VLPVVLLLPDARALRVLDAVQFRALTARDDAVGLRTILQSLDAILSGIETCRFTSGQRAGTHALVDPAILDLLSLVDARRMRLRKSAASGSGEDDGYGESDEHDLLPCGRRADDSDAASPLEVVHM
jgi:hypothetical protein